MASYLSFNSFLILLYNIIYIRLFFISSFYIVRYSYRNSLLKGFIKSIRQVKGPCIGDPDRYLAYVYKGVTRIARTPHPVVHKIT